MIRSKIKICGLSKIETLNFCIKNKVDYFGMIFYDKSPRFINYKIAAELINFAKNKSITPVGVFVNCEIKNLIEILKKINLKFIQLHGNENNEYLKKIKEKVDVKIIKCLGIEKKKDFDLLKSFSFADYFLFDYKAKKNDLPGGNAKSFDWSLLKDLKIEKPWFISGGININNIKEIDEYVIPYGIDISSGVEDFPGEKNLDKINKIMSLTNE